MKTKSFILLLVGIVVVGGAVGGAFFGGEALGKKNEQASLTQTMQNRIGQFANAGAGAGGGGTRQPGGGGGAGGQFVRINPAGGGGGLFGGGTIGTIQSVSGNMLTVTTQNGSSVQVILGSNTTIEKIGQGTIGDLAAGANVTVGGQRNADGSIQAATILLNQTAR